MSREDVEEAIEVALGDRLRHEISAPRTVAGSLVKQQLHYLKRILRELPQDLTVMEILEALE